MINKKQISFFLLLYAAARIFSYFFSPETPLYTANPVNTVISALILLTTIYLLWKKDERGWYIVALEIILGGAGGFLAIEKLSLRTSLLIISLGIFFIQKIKNKELKNTFLQNRVCFFVSLFLYLWIGFSALRGYFAGHNISLIIADTIPYFFFLYYFPLRDLIKSEKFKQIALNALIAAIVGNFALIVITFIGYSSGLLILQDAYYHWYRDVALGKITELPFHFYRLVLNEHLLLVPILLWLLHRVIARSDAGATKQSPGLRGIEIKGLAASSRELLLAMTLLVVLSLNFTRIYLVALAVGLLCLFTRAHWKRWLTYSIFSFLFFIFSFTTIHLIASRGQSLGWEIFGVRLQSIVSPSVEDSSLSRMLLLPKIVEKIRQHPLLGSGLGDTVTVYSPIFKKDITTPHFDWGYLEIWGEMGLIGLALWLLVFGYWLLGIRKVNLPYKKFYIASSFALLIINLTSPALFHVLGIIWLTILLASCASVKQPLSSSDIL